MCTARWGSLPEQVSSHYFTASHLLVLSLKEDTMCQSSRQAEDEAGTSTTARQERQRGSWGWGTHLLPGMHTLTPRHVYTWAIGTQADMYLQSTCGHAHTHGSHPDPGASGCLLGVRWPQGPGTFMSPYLG